jgi:nucleoside-diphosphate-sugar epimerase
MVVGVGPLGLAIARALAQGNAPGVLLLDGDPVAVRRAKDEILRTTSACDRHIVPIGVDISNPAAGVAFERYAPSIVFHVVEPAAALADAPLGMLQAAESQVMTVERVVADADRCGVDHLVVASTRSGFDPLDGLSALGEAVVFRGSQSTTRSTVVRCASLLEERDGLVPDLAAQIDRGGVVHIPPELAARRHVSVNDAAELILLAARDHDAASPGESEYEIPGERVDAHHVAEDLARLRGLRLGLDVTIAASEISVPSGRWSRGLPHPDDARLRRLGLRSCKPHGVDDRIAALRELVDARDARAIKQFATGLERELVSVCRRISA